MLGGCWEGGVGVVMGVGWVLSWVVRWVRGVVEYLLLLLQPLFQLRDDGLILALHLAALWQC